MPKETLPTARSIAARVLERVVVDGAFAAAALDSELASQRELDPRDGALATELVYGVLRTRSVLRRELVQFVRKGLDQTDGTVVTHLLVSAYQILFLDRVPPFAAVDSAVELVRKARGAKLAGFANAVLRQLVRGGRRLDRASAILESTPAWLRAELEADVGVEEAHALLGASEGAPLGSTCVRLRSGRAEPSWLVHAEQGRASPRARILRSEGDLRRHAEWKRGDVVIQEEGAQVVALALGVRPGDRVLDACAGRGQKTGLLADELAGTGALFASDVHPSKLRVLERELARLGLPPPELCAVDLSRGTGNLPSDFDRVLVDAPCTGSGTLRRRPEIALRLEPSDPARLSVLAEHILRNAARLARPGGRVVFAVCSVFTRESEALVERVADVLEPAAFDSAELAAVTGADATSFRLLPLRHGTDGYFVASFVKR
jgi:16S rRNA (cytosine967-C5)-methyltransferase